MSGLVEHLLAERTPLELAKELAQQAKENAALRERVARLEMELFWMKATPAALLPADIQQGLDTIDAARLRRQERERADSDRNQNNERRAHNTAQTNKANWPHASTTKET